MAPSKTTVECCPPATAPTVPKDEAVADAQLAQLAKALGHPARVAIMRKLLRCDSCVCGELVEELPFAQSTVSQHLKQLKEAGLVRGEVDGPRVCYCADRGVLGLIPALIKAL